MLKPIRCGPVSSCEGAWVGMSHFASVESINSGKSWYTTQWFWFGGPARGDIGGQSNWFQRPPARSLAGRDFQGRMKRLGNGKWQRARWHRAPEDFNGATYSTENSFIALSTPFHLSTHTHTHTHTRTHTHARVHIHTSKHCHGALSYANKS